MEVINRELEGRNKNEIKREGEVRQRKRKRRKRKIMVLWHRQERDGEKKNYGLDKRQMLTS